MIGKRNAYALAAQQRKAGPHSDARRPDVFDAINEYTDEQLEELKDRVRGMESMNPKNCPDFGVGDRVRCTLKSPFLNCEGLVVKRDLNVNNDPVWTVDFEGAGTVTCMLSHELERVYE
jgi:hypothetical protein